MPCHHQVFPEIGVLFSTYIGTVGIADILGLLDEIDADPEYQDGMTEFADMSGLEGFEISPSDAFQIAALIRGLYARRQNPTNCVIWAPGDRAFLASTTYQTAFATVPKMKITVARELAQALQALEDRTAEVIHEHIRAKRPRLV